MSTMFMEKGGKKLLYITPFEYFSPFTMQIVSITYNQGKKNLNTLHHLTFVLLAPHHGNWQWKFGFLQESDPQHD